MTRLNRYWDQIEQMRRLHIYLNYYQAALQKIRDDEMVGSRAWKIAQETLMNKPNFARKKKRKRG